MAQEMLARLTEELQLRGDSPVREVAYIWIAPNKLHQQSYLKMRSYFSGTRLLRAVMYDEMDMTDGTLHVGEILFVNWESINKEKNIIVRDTEQNCSLFEMTRRTQAAGIPIVIIIDEEHESSYKSDQTPKYDTINTALMRSRLSGAVVILGTATPSIVSMYRARAGFYREIRLTQRHNRTPLPLVRIADMRQELREGNRSVFSRELYRKIRASLDRGRQAILFLRNYLEGGKQI